MDNQPIKKEGTTGSGLLAQRPIHTIQQLRTRLETDPQFVEEMKKHPQEALAIVAGAPLDTDPWIYRIVVAALGLAILASIGGAIYLTAIATKDSMKDVPQVLTALGSASVGALAGLLAPSPTKKNE